VSGDLGGRTLTAGVYKSASSLGLTGALTLDAQGNPNAVFIFQAGSTLTTASGSHVKQLCRIFESDSPELAERKLRETVGTLLDAAAADEVASHLAILVGLNPGATVADRETLFFSVRCFIEAVASNRPSVLIFEDLHWADASLLDLVELLGARLRDLPVLVLVLARPDLLDARPGWGGGLPGYMTFALGPLSEDDARQLAVERLPLGGALDFDKVAGVGHDDVEVDVRG